MPRLLTAYDGSLYLDVGLSRTSHLMRVANPESKLEIAYQPGPGFYTRPSQLTVFDGWLYFTGALPNRDLELHRTNGIVTEVVTTIGGPSGSEPNQLTVLGDDLYFVAHSENRNRDLYRTDGTEAGTVQLTDIESDTRISWLTAVEESLYFAIQTDAGHELWRSDGSREGTQIVASFPPVENALSYWRMFEADGSLFFQPNFHELWTTDGTLEGTQVFGSFASLHSRGDCPSVSFAFEGQLFLSIGPCATHVNRLATIDLTPEGDVDANRRVDSVDIDVLSEALRNQATDAVFDLNGDGSVSAADRDHLMEVCLATRNGDFNLDGRVAFDDFLLLSDRFGSTNAGWTDGDANGNGMVDFADFLLLSANFGFGQRFSTQVNRNARSGVGDCAIANGWTITHPFSDH